MKPDFLLKSLKILARVTDPFSFPGNILNSELTQNCGIQKTLNIYYITAALNRRGKNIKICKFWIHGFSSLNPWVPGISVGTFKSSSTSSCKASAFSLSSIYKKKKQRNKN
uniref:Uncharacterized protein n=1 Tax=Catharus ustulatus TaxID=91951 RepID=A0A8C3TT62_CATUS